MPKFCFICLFFSTGLCPRHITVKLMSAKSKRNVWHAFYSQWKIGSVQASVYLQFVVGLGHCQSRVPQGLIPSFAIGWLENLPGSIFPTVPMLRFSFNNVNVMAIGFNYFFLSFLWFWEMKSSKHRHGGEGRKNGQSLGRPNGRQDCWLMSLRRVTKEAGQMCGAAIEVNIVDWVNRLKTKAGPLWRHRKLDHWSHR